jgi:hypothetical protein
MYTLDVWQDIHNLHYVLRVLAYRPRGAVV